MEKGNTDIVVQICAKHKAKVVYRNPKGEYFTDMNLALLSVGGDGKKIETCAPAARKGEAVKGTGTEKPVEAIKVPEKEKTAKVVTKTPETKQTEEMKPEESQAETEGEQPKAESEDE